MKNKQSRAIKLQKANQNVYDNTLMKHMRHMAYDVYYKVTGKTPEAGSDSEALIKAEQKRLRKAEKRSNF